MLHQFDKIYIKDLSLRCIVGVSPDERTKKQEVIINVVIHADLSRACDSDAIEDTVDYKRISKEILATVESSSYYLIERIAQVVADICFADARVQNAKVTVEKPGALRFAKAPAVTIYRQKSSV